MRLPLQFFLRFLRSLALFLREGWNRSNRRLWDIFALLRLRFSPGRSNKRDDIGRDSESQPTKLSSTTVICASGLPPHLSPIPGGDTPDIDSPPTFSFRRPTLGPEDVMEEANENIPGHLGVDGDYLDKSGSFFRSDNLADRYDDPNSIRLNPHRGREDFTSNSPASASRSISRRSSHRQASRDRGYHQGTRQWQGYSHYQPSVNSFHSPPDLTGAETAARLYLSTGPPTGLPPPSRPPSIVAGSAASHISHTPATRPLAQKPSSDTRSRRGGSPVPTFSRQSGRVTPPGSQELPRPPPNSGTMGSVHRDGAAGNANAPSPSSPEIKLIPMFQIDRYEKHKKVIIGTEGKKHIFRPVTTQFPRESPPENWSPLMHPEGALYWVDSTSLIYTDADMCDPGQRTDIGRALEKIDKLKESNPLPEDNWELALELGRDDETGEPICSYYFVYHENRCLFWLHEFDVEKALEGLRGVTELPHVHLSLQVQYWTHWEMFPHNRVVPDAILRELTGILVHAGVDCMTSSDSTAAYSEEELGRFLGYVERITTVGGDCGFSACIVGRLMGFFSHARYINFHGQRGARLTHDQTIYGTHRRRTYLIKVLSVFLFYAPALHLKSLESVYTDSVLYQHRWAQFITRLQNDWTEFILFGIVLLIANVAFLAAPSADPGDHNPISVHLASYLSIITSIGSVVIGLLLLRQHKTQPQESSEEAEKYLRGCHHDALGFETLAIQYSLPYALLLWSTIAFTTAFCLESLVFTHQLWVRLPVGITLAVITFLVFWCIWTSIGAGKYLRVVGGSYRLKDWLADFARRLRDKPGETGQGVGEP